MAGIAMRQLAIAKIVSNVVDAVIATPYQIKDMDGIRFVTYRQDDTNSLRDIVHQFDIVLFQGHILHHFPFFQDIDT